MKVDNIGDKIGKTTREYMQIPGKIGKNTKDMLHLPSKLDMPEWIRNHPYPKVKAREAYFELPKDRFTSVMHTSPERVKPGSVRLDKNWKMSASELPPQNQFSPEWKAVDTPSQWAVEDNKLFSHAGNVWYMKRFAVLSDEVGPDKHLALKFNGVDYESEVYLNGEKLGEHEGYFAPFKFNLDGKIKPYKYNTLLVKVDAPFDAQNPFLKKQIKGVLVHHDCRPGGTNPIGTPEPLGSTGGIWNDVMLEVTGRETIENQWVDTEKLSDDHKQAELKFNYQFVNHDEKNKPVKLQIRYAPMGETDPEKFKQITRDIVLKPGENQVGVKAVQDDPQLWWTHDLGEPNLYQMETSIIHDDKVSDSMKGHFGIRKLEYGKYNGTLKLNDTPIFQKGSNYIATEWLSTYNEERYTNDLQQMKEGNLNAVRVHAHVLPQEFYDSADKEGMLVWADFPLHWGVSIRPSVIKEAKEQYKEFIQLYRNHPSIWNWSAQNEPLPYNYPMDIALDRVAAELDPTRAHKAESGAQEHFYPGWYTMPYGDNYTAIRRYPHWMPSEFGAQGIPESIKEVIPPENRWPINEPESQELWKFHDFQPKETFRHLGEPSAFKDLDDYIATSQKYQFDYNKYTLEYYRRHKYHRTGGMYQFMFKEAWPSVTWGVVDYKNQPKMAFTAMKEALAPRLLSIAWTKSWFKPGDTVKTSLWTVNDPKEKVNMGRVNWFIYRAGDEKKQAVSKGDFRLTTPEDSSVKAGEVRFKLPKDAKPGDKWVMEASWRDEKGGKISKNSYLFGVRPEQKEYRYIPVNKEYPDLKNAKHA